MTRVEAVERRECYRSAGRQVRNCERMVSSLRQAAGTAQAALTRSHGRSRPRCACEALSVGRSAHPGRSAEVVRRSPCNTTRNSVPLNSTGWQPWSLAGRLCGSSDRARGPRAPCHPEAREHRARLAAHSRNEWGNSMISLLVRPVALFVSYGINVERLLTGIHIAQRSLNFATNSSEPGSANALREPTAHRPIGIRPSHPRAPYGADLRPGIRQLILANSRFR